MSNVNDILRKHLVDGGYGGLCRHECGCHLDMLAPCDGVQLDCRPAYRVRCVCESGEHRGYMCEKEGQTCEGIDDE